MKTRSLWATAVAFVCLLGVVSARQGGPDQAAPMSEQRFKNVLMLKGIPVDTFFDVMGMFAASMGDDCTYCHVKEATFRDEAFAVSTPRIQRARQMIAMTQALNKTYFGGAPRITCFTCHRGSYSPWDAPRLSLQYSPPDEDPDAMMFPADTSVSVDKVFERYIEALGGAARLGALTSFVARGHTPASTQAATKCQSRSSRSRPTSGRGWSACSTAIATACSTVAARGGPGRTARRRSRR